MADSYTTNLNLTLPEVGSSRDTWGGKINGDLSDIDALFAAGGTGTSVGLNVGSGKTLSVAGTASVSGTFNATGTVNLDTAVVINDSGADKDVRIEGDTDANLFFTDASTDRVGVGTNAPTAKFTVVGDQHVRTGYGVAFYDSTNANYWSIYNSSGTYVLSNGSPQMKVNSSGEFGVGGDPVTGAKMAIAGDTHIRGGAGLALFNSANSGYWSQYNSSGVLIFSNGSERARIDASGNFGVNTNSPGTYGKFAVGTPTAGYGILSVNNSAGGGGGGQLSYYYSTAKLAYVDCALSNGAAGSETASLAFAVISNGTLSKQVEIDPTGNLKFNSGFGSVGLAYGCRAWVNFNGTGTVAIRASGNVTSITDNGVGTYTVNITNAMPDTNYSCLVTKQNAASNLDSSASDAVADRTTTSVKIFSLENNAVADTANCNVAIFR